MTAFETFVNTELPVRIGIIGTVTAGNYMAFVGIGGLQVVEKTPAQVLADIGGQAAIAASVDHKLARYNSTDNIQGSGITISDSDNITGVNDLTVAGNIAVTGTVDTRDVNADGTKLDTIEASATADQSDEEIRTAVEAATDSNVFTDADHTKLNGTTGAGVPSSTPVDEGDVYVDTTNDSIYMAKGTASSADWVQVNGGGGGPDVSTGPVDPTSTPAAEGDIYIDTTADKVWMAKGTASSADWVRIGHEYKYTTITRSIYISNPESTDVVHMGYWPNNAEFVRILGTTDVGTVSFKINIRTKLAPDASTSNYLNSSAVQATASGLDQTSFTINQIAVSAGEHLVFEATGTGSAPQELWVTVEARLK